jgi:hypothetical protein
LDDIEHTEGSSLTKLHSREREGILGKDTDALVSLQRQALTRLQAGAAVGWDAILALSLIKERFTGRDSIKLDREEELMNAVLQ